LAVLPWIEDFAEILMNGRIVIDHQQTVVSNQG